MYKIISEGEIIDVCDKPNYIRLKQETGCFVNTDKEHAEGLGVRGTAYNLPGHTMSAELKEAQAFTIPDNGQYLYEELDKAKKENEELQQKNDELTECILEMSEIIYA